VSERTPDDEYFAKIEREKTEKLKQKLSAEAAVEQREALRKLHHNRCGKCGAAMDTHVFKGLEIEICPDCGAVLLDSGELQTLAGSDQSGIFSGIRDLFGGRR
jgi:uncharacterized protein